VHVLSSPPSAPLLPDVHPDTALPTTGAAATTTPLVVAGLVLGAGGACVMAGVGRRRRPQAPERRLA